MFLWSTAVYGPVRSRRLGRSLGLNLLPVARKVCSYDCPYCECGWTRAGSGSGGGMPGAQELAAALEEALRRDPQVDAITLAGNGEPTLHPQLVEILDRVGQLRDRYAPAAKRVLLTNGIRLADPPLAEQVLARTEQIEIKLDAGTEQTFQQVARPTVPWSLARLTALLERLGSRVCVQCCLFGGPISNTSEADLLGMVEILKRARPRLTEIYSIDRAPAHSGLRAAPEACVQLAGMLREAGLEVFSYS